jgi:hypothetical protein
VLVSNASMCNIRVLSKLIDLVEGITSVAHSQEAPTPVTALDGPCATVAYIDENFFSQMILSQHYCHSSLMAQLAFAFSFLLLGR